MKMAVPYDETASDSDREQSVRRHEKWSLTCNAEAAAESPGAATRVHVEGA